MSKQLNKVSVIIAVYNSEKYISQTLESVRNQTLKEIEIICVDDGSTDMSLEIMREFEKRDSRIRVFEHREKTDGAGAARNLGIAYANGEYLSILDADDFFEADMLEKTYHNAKLKQADVVIWDGVIFDEYIQADRECDFILRKEYLPKDKNVFSPKENAEQLFLMTCGAAWNALFKRELIEREQIRFQSFHHADDLGFVYLAYACANRIAVMHEKFIHYRKNTGTSQADKCHLWYEASYLALEQIREELVKRDLLELYKVAFVQEVMVYSLFYLDGMKDWEYFTDLYNKLKNQYFTKFGVYDISDAKFRNTHWVKIKNFIHEKSAEEYIYHQLKGLEPFKSDIKWKENIPKGTKIILYGAGRFGTSIFTEIIQSKEYKIMLWVDQKHEAIGYPIQSPQKIKTMEFDYVVVCIISESIYESVKAYLMSMGVEEEKIRWIGTTKKM